MTKRNTIKKPVVADEELQLHNSTIIGTYEGECADANITNLNGLDITREVWENVFDSDEYKQAIEHGWYIGYLGHPDEPDCQDFRRACIVMTEGYIDDNSKVYGKFNLIDTPVGRIVKAFQDAGVIFGISVRGAGDIVDNSVDPDTFVFRGFDLVTFPAFPESIPKFTSVAASTNRKQRKKYQAVCAAVKDNMEGLDTVESINIVQSCFAKQSDEYQELEARKSTILGEDEIPELPLEPLTDMNTNPEESMKAAGLIDEDEVDPRVDSMTKLYLELKEKYDTLLADYGVLQSFNSQLAKDAERKVASIERITNDQVDDLNHVIEDIESSLKIKSSEVRALNHKLDLTNNKLDKVQSSLYTTTDKLTKVSAENERLRTSLSSIRSSVRELKSENSKLDQMNQESSKKLKIMEAENLKYNQKIEASQQQINEKEAIISNLQSKLDETVRKQAQVNRKSLNFDDKIAKMQSQVEASESLINEYQNAYANLYANAVGVRLPKLSVTSSTDVSALQQMIRANTSIQNQSNIEEPTHDVDSSYFDMTEYDDDNLVTL